MLDSDQAICISICENIALGTEQDQGEKCFDDSHRPELAEPAVVSKKLLVAPPC